MDSGKQAGVWKMPPPPPPLPLVSRGDESPPTVHLWCNVCGCGLNIADSSSRYSFLGVAHLRGVFKGLGRTVGRMRKSEHQNPMNRHVPIFGNHVCCIPRAPLIGCSSDRYAESGVLRILSILMHLGAQMALWDVAPRVASR